MKSEDLIAFETDVNNEDNIIRLINMATIVMDQARILQLKDQIEKLEIGMYEGEKGLYCFDVPAFSDEELHLATTTIKGRIRVLGEDMDKKIKLEEEPKII